MKISNLLVINNVFVGDSVIMMFVRVAIILTISAYIIRKVIIPTVKDIIKLVEFVADFIDSFKNRKRKEISNLPSYAVYNFQKTTVITHKHFSIKNTKD